MKKAVVVLAFMFFCLGISHAESDTSSAKKLAIEHMMEVTGAANKIRQIIPQMFHRVMDQKKVPSPPKDAISKDEFASLLTQLLLSRIDGPNGLLAQTCSVYEKYYSLDEIEELTKFYVSPAGKKISSFSDIVFADPLRLQQILATGFTANEIEDLTKFIASPLGKKSLSIAGKMSIDQIQVGKQIALDLMPELQSRMMAMMKERGAPLPDSAAVPIDNPAPKYPLPSLRLGEEGTVVLRLLVTVKGTVGLAEVKTSSGFARLDGAAERAAKTWIFWPAIEKGQQIETSFDVKFIFKYEKSQKDSLVQNPVS